MLKRLARIFAAFGLAVAIVLAAAFAFVQTGFARQQIETAIERSLASEGVKAEVSGLGGLLPFNLRLDKLRLSDDRGTWLEVDNARAALAPAALLSGRVELRELGAERIAVARLPEPRAPSEPAPAALPELPVLPEQLPAMSVNRLSVSRLELGAPILGRSAVLTLAGHALVTPDGRTLDARLALERVDEPTARLELGLALDLGARSMALRLVGEERGGLLAAATALEHAGPARIHLRGEGPLTRWQGTVSGALERVGELEGKLALDLEGLPGVELSLSGKLEPTGVPATVLRILGERPEAALALLPESPRRLRLERLRLATPVAALDGSGALDLEAGRVQAQLTGGVADLGALAPLLGEPLSGRLDLALSASGALAAPEASLRIEGEALRAARFSARALALELATMPTMPGVEPAGLLFALEGRVEGATLDDRALGPEGVVLVDGEATLPPEGPLSIAAVRLRGAGAEVWLAGQLYPRTLEGELGYGLRVPDLEALALLVGPAAPAGAFDAQGTVRLAGPTKIEGEFAALALELADLPPGLVGLVGRSARLQGRLALADQRLRAEDLILRTERSEARGGLSFDLSDRRLAGTLRLALPELSALSELVGVTLSGSGVVETRIAGTSDRPELALSARLDRPAVADLRFDRLAVDGKAAFGADRTAFEMEGEARLANEPLRLAARGAVGGERLEVDRLEFSGLKTTLTGGAAIDLSRPLVNGRLRGRAEDLAALAPLGLRDLAGAVEVEIEASPETGRQNGRIRLIAERIRAPAGELASARLDLSGRDLLGRAAVAGEAVLEGFRAPDTGLERVQLSVEGPIAEVGFALDAKGSRAGRPMSLQANGRLAALVEPRRLELAKLTGQIAGQTIELRQPARIVLDKGVLDLGTLDLKIGEATARTRAALEGGQIRAEATVDGFPLAALALVGLPELSGRAGAELTVTGAPSAPDARGLVRVEGLAPRGGGLPAGTLRASGALRAGRELAFSFTATGLGPSPLAGELRLPVRVDLRAMALALDRAGTLRGILRGPLDLDRLEPLLALDGQRLGGRLEFDLAFDGRTDAPTASGTVRLTRGRFRDADSGLRLRILEASAVARGDRLVVESLKARDAGDGRLSGAGWFSFPDSAWQLRLVGESFRVFANEWGTAVVSGALEARGAGREGKITGNLSVERAELRLPDAAPAVPPTLAVEETGRGARNEVGAAARPPPAIALDVLVEGPQRLFLRGRGLESEWGGSAQVRGHLFDPDVVGRVELRRGRLDFLGVRFRLAEGTVEFDGARPPWPRLDVLAEARRADITARVGIKGRLPGIEIELASEPPLPKEEVLARLLFNRDLSRIAPLQAAVLANSLATLRGGGIDALSPVRAAAGLDTLDVGEAENGGAALRAGKYVSERIYVEVQRGLTPETSRARVEVDLGYNLRGTTEVRETGGTGFGLEWRYDY
ncbi:MAG: translocation/assembly module TamB domain-containing protein [Geminicoccaceae bacterium]|nr:translocation/assembly module TamB domain-containing protein [Geminicoccaceae bacterium]